MSERMHVNDEKSGVHYKSRGLHKEFNKVGVQLSINALNKNP